MSKAKSVIVSGLNVIVPGDAGYLWEAVKKSGSVEKVLGIGERQEDRKYLKALAESKTHLLGKQGVRYYQSWQT